MKTAIPSREGWVEVAGGGIYYRMVGEGRPLLILHGGPGFDHRHMLPFTDLASDYQVIFYDQRGSGQSISPVDSQYITVDRFVEDLEALRRALQLDTVTLLGHSWGATLAMHYASQYPRHLGALVLMAPGAASPQYRDAYSENILHKTTPPDRERMQEIMRLEGFQKKEPAMYQEYFRLAVIPLFHDPSRIDELDLTFVANTANNLLEIGKLLIMDLDYPDMLSRISTIQCPTLLVHGESDPFPLEGTRQIQKHLPHSRLVILKNSGHFMFIEAGEELFGRIREFLTETD